MSERTRGRTLAVLVAASMLAAPGWAHAFSTIGVGWDGPGNGAATVQWHMASGTPDLTNERTLIIDALSDWVAASLVDITFQEVLSPGGAGAIDFYFCTSTALGCPHGVTTDGAGGTLAFAFFPDDVTTNPQAGDVLFDDDETWTGNSIGPGSCSSTACDLYYVALHEIGHALGLQHPIGDESNAPAAFAAIMSPFFNPIGGPAPGFGSFDTLQADDIAGVCSLYSCGGLGSVALAPEPPVALLLLLIGGALPSRRTRALLGL